MGHFGCLSLVPNFRMKHKEERLSLAIEGNVNNNEAKNKFIGAVWIRKVKPHKKKWRTKSRVDLSVEILSGTGHAPCESWSDWFGCFGLPHLRHDQHLENQKPERMEQK